MSELSLPEVEEMAPAKILSAEDMTDLRERIVDVMRTVYDPEIPVNIYDLGLIYGLDVAEDGSVQVQMTLTAPGCPVAQTFPGTVEQAVLTVPDVSSAKVELVWDPPWTQERMSESARYQLNMF
jgi:FeS assembly SUF system protein